MAGTNWQKIARHYKTGGISYVIYRGIKYIQWRRWCKKRGIDWRKFAKEENKLS